MEHAPESLLEAPVALKHLAPHQRVACRRGLNFVFEQEQKQRRRLHQRIWRHTEIGFLLHRDYWRQGLMREAMEALLPYYFGAVEKGGIGLEVVTADTDPRNEATLAFLHGFGFETTGRAERTFQVGGEGGSGRIVCIWS